jgi:pyruvate,water dikinase
MFDPSNEAVKRMISEAIRQAHKHNIQIGICGQAPFDIPAFIDFLLEQGIYFISLNPDSVVTGINDIAAVEQSAAYK